MGKTRSKDILGRIKAKEAANRKANYTFSLTPSLMAKFKTKCEKEEVSMASVVEEMISSFTDDK